MNNQQLTLATFILAVLAHEKGEGVVTSKVLAEGFGTNPVVIRRVLAQLKRAGLIESRRGSGGGSILAKPAKDITLRDAYAAISEDSSLLARHPGECGDGTPIAPIIAECLNDLFEDAEQALLRNLDAVSVQDLTQQVAQRLKS